MNELMLIADIAGVIGMGYFLWAEVKQLTKVRKTHKVKAISHTAYISKIKAIIATSVMLAITAMYMSLAVLFVEGIIAVWILYLMKKYKKKTLVPVADKIICGNMAIGYNAGKMKK